ncbi:AsmA family protein [Halomonas sp. GXIMD04776]|uniref:AsmA family protein n=1 Tax=Halomonas sp. GXIMD04776 TaxID=3415605 RepID=UPI003CA6FD81
MRQTFRWSLLGVLGLVALLVGPMLLIESSWARALLEDQISKRLNGRDVEIGELEIDWGWPLSIRLERLSVANPDWVPHSHLLDLEALALTLDLGALLQGKVALERLHLQRPEIHLARREDGTTSWSGLFAGDDKQSGEGGGPTISPDVVSIDQGRLTYGDAARDLELAVEVRTQDSDQATNAGGPRRILIDGQGIYQDESVTFSGRGGTPSAALNDESEAYPLQLQGALGQLHASFDGRLRDIAQPLSLEGKIDVSAPEKTDLAALLDKPELDLPGLEFHARLSHVDRHWALEEIDAQLGDSTVIGSARVTLGERPRIDVQLDADRLKLEQWGVTELGSDQERRQAEQAIEQKAEHVAWDRRWAERLVPLTKVDARIDLAVDRVSYGDTRLSGVVLRGGLEQGRLTLERLRVAQSEGEMAAQGWLKVGSDTLDGDIELQARRLDLGQALAPLGFQELGILDGKLNARLERGDLELDDTALTYRSPDQELLLRVNAESTSIGDEDESRVRLWGNGRRQGEPFEYDVEVGPLLTLDDPDKAYPVQGWATSRKSRLEVDGNLEQPLKIAQAQGSFQLSGPNPARLNRLTGLNLPALPPYRLAGELRVKDELVRLLGLDGHFGNSDVGGDVRLRLSERNMLWATLYSQRLDLDDLGPLLGVAPDTGSGEAVSSRQQRLAAKQRRSPGIFPDTQWNLEGLRRMDAEVRYSATQVSAKDIPISEFELDLSLEEGVLTLEPLQAGIGGGQMITQLRMDARKAPLDGSLDLSLRRINLKPLLRKVELSDIARDSAGTIGGQGKVRFRGNSLDEVMAGLDGNLELAMSSGRLDMLVIEALGLDLAEALIGTLVDSDKVPMQCAYTRLDATRGEVVVEQFFIGTADSNLTGGGSIDLGDERLDLVFEAHPKDPSLLASDSPVKLQGLLSEPKVEVVSRELVARGVLSVLGAVIAPPLAILPWIEPGTGEGVGPGCRQVLREFSTGEEMR